MRIGVPKEIKPQEFRVGLTPGSVRELKLHGHNVLVETNAGHGIGFTDQDYEEAGATILSTPEEIFAQSEMIVKVKEPLESEYKLLREDQILFTYLHLAADLPLTKGLMESKCVAIAYETVTDSFGRLPLLYPMSEVAGRMAIQVGAHSLEKYSGGSGVLLGGVPGVEPAHVVVIGGGAVGTGAARMAMGLEANVTVIDKSIMRLQQLDYQYGSRLNKVYSTVDNIEKYVAAADLVVGAVLLPGAAAPKLVSRDMLANMRVGSVLVDVAIDQGGCFETSRPSTHEKPTYVVDDIVHYCVTNMPGAVPRTSTFALNNATLPYVINIANKGYKKALQEDEHLLNGLNVYQGQLTYEAVAQAFDLESVKASSAL